MIHPNLALFLFLQALELIMQSQHQFSIGIVIRGDPDYSFPFWGGWGWGTLCKEMYLRGHLQMIKLNYRKF